MPAESRENPLLKKGNSDAFFKEKYLTKNIQKEDIHPKFENGILSFTVPKEKKAALMTGWISCRNPPTNF